MRTFRPTRLARFVTPLAGAICLAACGGGGGGSSPSAPATPGPSAVTGSVTKGPFSGATITLIAFDAAGNATGSPITSTISSSGGGFSITAPAGTYLVQSS
ncbi:MAG TPA: hypothetical protein VM369_08825, partial [Candidatus Binatia bacterium]|nr:hypothetical protein [Candidatus Binatia bacterium]